MGGWVRYTLVLSNSAAYDQQDNAGNALVDVLPPELALTTASATSGPAVGLVATNTVTWNGVVPAHGSVTITINANIVGGSPAAPIVNQASFSFDADGRGPKESTGLTVGSGPGGVTPPDLELEKVPTLSTVGLLALLAALAAAGPAVIRKNLG